MFASFGKLNPFITEISCSLLVGNLDVLDVFQDVDTSVCLEETDEVRFTLFELAKPVIIEVATVEDVDWRVEVCKDLDIALEMVELGRLTHNARRDRDAKRVLGVAIYTRGKVEMEAFLIGINHAQNLGVKTFTWNRN
ncbi:hypothetical protein DM2_2274 [Halorubrum sp. DM2]|nr:hypothetical protein DM2_2274 [Halorubrum sp. DM2]